MTRPDLVIRSATIADGSGGPLREGDIAITNGVISAVGQVAEAGQEEISAKGLLATPGFIDIHTHYDGQAVWDSRLTPSSWHGVTTAVMGNCGVGFAPVRAQDHQLLIELMEGVEDIPGSALHEGLDWEWESFPAYLDKLSARQFDMDVAAQLPHGALRVYVMGERAARLEPANADDCAQMGQLAEDAMRAGAIGFSTSRTLNHRTVKGDPTPSLRAAEDELQAIAAGMQRAGRGVFELISDWDQPDMAGEFALVERLVAASGRPLSLSLYQTHDQPDGWRDLLGHIESAAAKGLPVKGQIAPRQIGLLFGLQGTLNPFMAHPSFRAVMALPLAEKVAALKDKALRAKLIAEAPQVPNAAFVKRLTDWAGTYVLGNPPDYEPGPEKSIAARAAAAGHSPAEEALDRLLDDGGQAFLFQPFSNYASGTLDPCRTMIASPHTLIGLGDGGAHVGIISDASFMTFLLTHWGRDRAAGRFDLPFLIKRLTADNAAAMGLSDRGRIAVGLKADLNLIDPDQLRVEAPSMAFDLPAGGKRLLQRARGYRATIVSGKVTYRDGEPTGALPGRLIRA